MVVVMKPLIQILLELFNGSIELVSEGFSAELVEDGAVESLDKSVCPRGSHLGPSVFDIGEVQKDLVRINHGPAAVLPAVIREDMLNHEAMKPVKGQYPIIEHIYGCFKKLRGVKFPEGIGTVGIHNGLKLVFGLDILLQPDVAYRTGAYRNTL